VLFLALLGGFPLDAVGNSYRLLQRLASIYFRLDVLTKRGFACRFDERHDYFFFVAGEGFIIVVVRMTCGAFGIGLGFGAAFGAIILDAAAGRPPPGFVVPSFGIGDLARSRSISAMRSFFIVPDLYNALVYLLAGIYLPFLAGFLAVLALSLNALAVGAPLAPGLRIFSPDPAAMRAFLA
jgi:hypothetical protein